LSTVDLSATSTQTNFAALVGVSQQAIADRVKSGVLTRDGTVGEWLYLYCDQLRKEAAGRSGEAQGQLTFARIEESKENAAEKKQRRLVAAGQLLQLADVQHLLLELPTVVRTQMLQCAEKIQEGIETKYKLSLEETDVDEPIRAALRHIADRAAQLRKSFDSDSRGVDTEADTTNR